MLEPQTAQLSAQTFMHMSIVYVQIVHCTYNPNVGQILILPSSGWQNDPTIIMLNSELLKSTKYYRYM